MSLEDNMIIMIKKSKDVICVIVTNYYVINMFYPRMTSELSLISTTVNISLLAATA